ncbi:MAG: hypothetical protein M0D54_05830 [Hyphomonadaceae bacterium JAD_PAG50586_4]|nr:MAG: hypothetical protein M0D54_05830 [Hyphomonadaceae bacterium JAD_PAG50586_4]
MKTPEDKAILYLIVIIVIMIVAGFVLNLITGAILGVIGMGVAVPGAAF